MLILTPVRHLLKGVFIDRCSAPDLLIPYHQVRFLFEPFHPALLRWSDEIRGRGLWRASDASIQAKFTEKIERDVLPMLRELQTLYQFRAYSNNLPMFAKLEEHPAQNAILHAAQDHFEDALVACEMVSKHPTMREYWPEEYAFVIDELKPQMLAEDRGGVARAACSRGDDREGVEARKDMGALAFSVGDSLRGRLRRRWKDGVI